MLVCISFLERTSTHYSFLNTFAMEHHYIIQVKETDFAIQGKSLYKRNFDLSIKNNILNIYLKTYSLKHVVFDKILCYVWG